jgi:hypothetical protein
MASNTLFMRVQGMAASRDRKSKVELVDWVDKFFDETLRSEEDVWWCRVYKHVATAATQVPEIGGLTGDDEPLEQVTAAARAIHRRAMQRRFVEQLQDASILGWKSGAFSAPPQARLVIDLG